VFSTTPFFEAFLPLHTLSVRFCHHIDSTPIETSSLFPPIHTPPEMKVFNLKLVASIASFFLFLVIQLPTPSSFRFPVFFPPLPSTRPPGLSLTLQIPDCCNFLPLRRSSRNPLRSPRQFANISGPNFRKRFTTLFLLLLKHLCREPFFSFGESDDYQFPSDLFFCPLR